MSTGLFSVVDLVDSKTTGESIGCTGKEWENIVNLYNSKYQMKPVTLHRKILETWDIILGLCQKYNNTDHALKYLKTICSTNLSSDIKKIIYVLELVLITLDRNSFILNQANNDRVTEYDYLVQIWAPLLTSITNMDNNIIRLKVGESTSTYTTLAKKRLYSDIDNVIGFKVDIRLLFDTKVNEYDLLAIEIGKETSMEKVTNDSGKLIREAKDILDNLIRSLNSKVNVDDICGYMLQICGLQGYIASIHLVKPGLYVTVHQKKIKFPTCISTLSTFIETLTVLITLIQRLEKNAHILKSALQELEDRRISLGKQLNRGEPLIRQHSTSSSIRPTWYSPPRNNYSMARLPDGLFGIDSSSNLTSHNIFSKGSESDANENTPFNSQEEIEDADEYGWTQKKGKWFNTFTKKFSTDNPYE